MYYHEIISMIAKAMTEKDEDAIYDIQRKVADLLLSDDERGAVDELLEAALESILE